MDSLDLRDPPNKPALTMETLLKAPFNRDNPPVKQCDDKKENTRNLPVSLIHQQHSQTNLLALNQMYLMQQLGIESSP